MLPCQGQSCTNIANEKDIKNYDKQIDVKLDYFVSEETDETAN